MVVFIKHSLQANWVLSVRIPVSPFHRREKERSNSLRAVRELDPPRKRGPLLNAALPLQPWVPPQSCPSFLKGVQMQADAGRCRHYLTPCPEVLPACFGERAFLKGSNLELGSGMVVSISRLDKENHPDAISSLQGSVSVSRTPKTGLYDPSIK